MSNIRAARRVRVAVLLMTATFALLAGLTAPANAEDRSGDGGVLVGFGDSVAAGFRASSSLADSPYALECQRTDEAYPTTVGLELGLRTFNVACSGATVPAGLNGPQPTTVSTVPAQLTQARALPHITLATITILANDVRWSYWIGKCIDQTTNCATPANTAAFRRLLAKGGLGLAKSLRSIVFGLRADHTALTGYYDPMGPLAGPIFGLTPDEIVWYRARLADLNKLLRAEARLFPRVSYVPVSLDAAAGDVILKPDDSAGSYGIFHPTDQGQSKIANAVMAHCQRYSCTG